MWLKSFVWSMLLQVCTILIFRLFYSHSNFWFQNFGFVKLLGKTCCPSTQQIVTRFVWRLVHTSESRRRNFVLISEAQNVCANFFGSHAFGMTPKICLSLEIRLSSSSKSFSLFPTLTKRCHKEVACNKVSCIGLAGPMLCGINHFLFGLVVCSNYVHIHTYVMYVYMCIYIYTYIYICIYIYTY